MQGDLASTVALDGLRARPTWRKSVVLFMRKKPLGAAGGLIVIFLIILALAAPVVTGYDPYETNKTELLQPPNATHYLGTDHLGRDFFSRIVWGARVSLGVGFGAMLLGVTLGTLGGVMSGYFGRYVDTIIMRLVDVQMGFPQLIFLLGIAAFLGPSIRNVIIAIGIGSFPGISRVVRSNVLAVKENQYMEAARAVGARHWRMMLIHVLPNVMPTVIVYASMYLAWAILSEASLGFLGVGVPPPNPSWGEMLSGSSRLYMMRAPWMAIFPGVALSLAVFGFNLFGDALRDVLDPRMRGS